MNFLIKTGLFILVLTLSACSGSIQGKIYLDNDGDNELDEGESGIGRIVYNVTKDGKSYKSGVTTSKTTDLGSFDIKVDEAGYYCVSVKSLSADYASSVGGPITSTSSSSKASLSKDDTTTTANDTTTTGTDTTATTTTTSGTSTTSSTTNSSTTAQSDTTESLKSCINVVNPMSKTTVDVPVAKNFQSSLTQLPSQDTITAATGDIITYPIQYPCSCKPMNLALPKNVYPPTSEIYGINQEILDISLALSSATELNIANYDITKDKLCKVEMKLVMGEAPDSGEVDISPKAMCPNDKELSLATQTIKWKKAKVEILLSVTGTDGNTPTEYWGEDLMFTVTVKNYRYAKSGEDTDAKMTVTLPKYSVAKTITPTGKCSGEGMQTISSCPIPSGVDTSYQGIFHLTEWMADFSSSENSELFYFDVVIETPDETKIEKTFPSNYPVPSGSSD